MDYPKLRSIDAFPVTVSGQRVICLRDPLNFTEKVLFAPFSTFFIISLFDGQHSILDIQAEYVKRFGDLLFKDNILEIVEELDSNYFLDTERFREFRSKLEQSFKKLSIRKEALAGNGYQSDPEGLKKQIRDFFIHLQGPGEPQGYKEVNLLKGAIIPHIDIRRGGICYAWSYKEIAESSNADLFIIFGISHFPIKRLFSLTPKDFETPLGMLETDKDVLNKILEKCSIDFLEDEFVHRSEHSIELQLIFLQYLYGSMKKIKILPILCGYFHEIVLRGNSPQDDPQFREFTKALKDAISTSGKKVCLIASADLAHVGPKFGDREPISPYSLQEAAEEDLKMLEYVERLDLKGFSHSIKKDNDRRRICGFPAIYTLLSIIEAREGKLLKYSQDPEPQTQSAVTFASMAFY